MSSRELEPNPRAFNGRKTHQRSEADHSLAGLNPVTSPTSCCTGACGSCATPTQTYSPVAQATVTATSTTVPPLELHGTRSEPSALLKVQAEAHGREGSVPMQVMIDSGASGAGFVDPSFV